MKFLLDNWYLFLMALGAGALLFVPALQKRAAAGEAPISPAGAVNLINREKAQIIDVCDASEYAAEHIGSAKHIPLAELESRLPTVVKNKSLPGILVCSRGARSGKAQNIAKKLGYDKAYSLEGGTAAWKAANYPVEKS